VLQQEGVFLQVFIREIELDLVHQLPDQLLVWRLPLLIQVLSLILTTTCGATEARRRQWISYKLNLQPVGAQKATFTYLESGSLQRSSVKMRSQWGRMGP
jgi:cell division protein FtsW (lipid II flippase)